jgi:anthranilate synthase component 2
MAILVVDNYDSFTYNLVQYLRELGAVVTVHRNDEIDVQGVRALDPEGVLISPGPGTPDDAGVSNGILAELGATLPVLGVCLGHQAIGQHYGARVVRAERLMHGRTSAHLPRGARRVSRAAQPVHRHALSLAPGGPGHAHQRARGHRAHGRGRDHGAAAP